MQIKQLVQARQTAIQPLTQRSQSHGASGFAVRTGIKAGDLLGGLTPEILAIEGRTGDELRRLEPTSSVWP